VVAAASPWAVDLDQVFDAVASSPRGLSTAAAAHRLARDGPNSIEGPRGHRGLRLLAAQFTSPIILILAGATVLSMVLGDLVDGMVILAIILASGGVGFWQEHTAGQAVDALLAQVRVHVEVRRDGVIGSVPIDEIVAGDIVVLAAGDVIPGDCRLLESANLLVDEAVLTGESYPVEKRAGLVAAAAALPERTNTLFMGTHVVSGTATALVVKTGLRTVFGAVSTELGARDVTTGFERGVTQFGMLLVRAMAVLVTVIFVVNVVLHRPLVESILFSLALAVGLTPQLLPAIVAVSLANGARRMAAEKVIVRRLDAIEDFGAMTVLCTDKTGTVTAGAVHLDAAIDIDGHPDRDLERLAALNASLQQGYPNPIDEAIIAATGTPGGRLVDEIPYDFTRRMLSVLVEVDGERVLITKGAFSEVLDRCTTAQKGQTTVPISTVRDAAVERFAALSRDGYRVLAVATRHLGADHVTPSDETGMTLRGLLAFHDPPKPGVVDAIERLERLGVSVRLVTGDNRLAAAKIAHDVGLDPSGELSGPDIDDLDDADLARRCATVTVFAEVEPLHKERIVQALRRRGEIVGFLGDGINDTVALHAADVGISVDTAVDVAKQTAAIVLLDKSLDVVSDGVQLGRQTFANTLKYIRVTTSANFGNMLSMAVAAAFLPFLPLLPRQILLLNFLSDIPGMTIAGDSVDAEQLESPRAWHLRSMRNFMIVYGSLSSVFDIATFAILRLGFDADGTLFRSAWFIESTLTELAVMLVLRTNRVFFRSRPGRGLLWTSAAVAVIAAALPFSLLAEPLGFVAVPAAVMATIVGLIAVYVVGNEVVKQAIPPQS
jgi:Mg2+-importing ATPase